MPGVALRVRRQRWVGEPSRTGALPVPRAERHLLGRRRLVTPVHLPGRNVFLVRGERPDVPERVGRRTGTIAVERILDRPQGRLAGGDALLEPRIDILDVEQDVEQVL